MLLVFNQEQILQDQILRQLMVELVDLVQRKVYLMNIKCQIDVIHQIQNANVMKIFTLTVMAKLIMKWIIFHIHLIMDHTLILLLNNKLLINHKFLINNKLLINNKELYNLQRQLPNLKLHKILMDKVEQHHHHKKFQVMILLLLMNNHQLMIIIILLLILTLVNRLNLTQMIIKWKLIRHKIKEQVVIMNSFLKVLIHMIRMFMIQLYALTNDHLEWTIYIVTPFLLLNQHTKRQDIAQVLISYYILQKLEKADDQLTCLFVFTCKENRSWKESYIMPETQFIPQRNS